MFPKRVDSHLAHKLGPRFVAELSFFAPQKTSGKKKAHQLKNLVSLKRCDLYKTLAFAI